MIDINRIAPLAPPPAFPPLATRYRIGLVTVATLNGIEKAPVASVIADPSVIAVPIGLLPAWNRVTDDPPIALPAPVTVPVTRKAGAGVGVVVGTGVGLGVGDGVGTGLGV
jgi:hypothetical protein